MTVKEKYALTVNATHRLTVIIIVRVRYSYPFPNSRVSVFSNRAYKYGGRTKMGTYLSATNNTIEPTTKTKHSRVCGPDRNSCWDAV